MVRFLRRIANEVMGEEMENPSLVGVTREGFFCGGGLGGETAKNEPKKGGVLRLAGVRTP